MKNESLEHVVPEERVIPSVTSSQNGQLSKKRIFGGVAIVAIAAVIGYGALTSDDGSKKKEEPILNINKGRDLDLAPKDRTPPPNPVLPQKEEVKQEPPKPPEEDEMSIAARRAPVLAIRGSNRQQPQQPQFAGTSSNDGFSGSDTNLQSKLKPTVLEGTSATVLQNLHMVIAQGTPIPCTLNTAISSDQPGFVTCTTPHAVKSASGQVDLMEKGTQIFGEYQSGVDRGQGRIFVLWTTALTPRGVQVNLASPATDAVGRAGMDGKIDTHFWERFGNAMFLSIVQDASNYGFSRLAETGSNSSSGYTQNSQSATRDAAGIAVENSINIKPTLYKNQGETVAIMVARNLDFSNIYRLRRTETKNRIYDRTVTGDMLPARRSWK